MAVLAIAFGVLTVASLVARAWMSLGETSKRTLVWLRLGTTLCFCATIVFAVAAAKK